MTSVPSHQPLLSGNKISSTFFIVLMMVLLVASCKQKRGLYYEDDKPASVSNGIDTIVWDSNPTDYPPINDGSVTNPVTPPVEPPITTPDPDPDPGIVDPVEPPIDVDPVEPPSTGIKSTYNIGFMLPFYTNKAAQSGRISSSSSIKSLEFYTGAKMALEKLAAEGLNAKVYAYDTQGSNSMVTSIVSKPEFSNMDLVFGPMKTEPLKITSSKVKNTKTAIISPWNPKTSITSKNPNYVQVAPSLKTHCQNIMKYVHKHHTKSNVVLVCKQGTSEKNYFRYFQDENKVLSGTSTPRLSELQAEYGDDIPLGDYFQPDSTVFIIPSWDEKFVSNFLRKVSLEKGSRKIVVYGLPQWMKFERMDYEYYERLNVHVSSGVFVDKDNFDVNEFRREYYNRTGTVPNTDAFLGYDLTLYFGRLLKDRGTDFLKTLDNSQSREGDYYHTNFNFLGDSPSGTENFSNINRFENNYVNILKFEGYKFQLAD